MVEDTEMIYFVTFCSLQEKVLHTETLRPIFLQFQYVIFTYNTNMCCGAHNTSCSHLLNTSPRKWTELLHCNFLIL